LYIYRIKIDVSRIMSTIWVESFYLLTVNEQTMGYHFLRAMGRVYVIFACGVDFYCEVKVFFIFKNIKAESVTVYGLELDLEGV